MSTIKQSEELTAFYRAYSDWVAAGAPEDRPFSTSHGLCSSALRWAKSHGIVEYALNNEMEDQWQAAGLDVSYPFNSPEVYDNRAAHRTQHLCPVRRAWVEEHAK